MYDCSLNQPLQHGSCRRADLQCTSATLHLWVCRWALEQTNTNLGPWISALDEQFDEEAIAHEADLVAARAAALEDEMARDAAAARCAG